MRTVKAISFSAVVCSALLTACFEHTLDDVTTPPGSPATPDAAPSTTPTNPSTPSQSNFERWMKCMDLSDFRTAGMVNAWNETIAEGEQTCETCHENGAEGFIVTPNEQKFFDTLKQHKLYALEYFTYDALAAQFVVVENAVAMTGVATGQDPHRHHPRFAPQQGLAASRAFAQLTQARYDAAAGNCP